jgi:hypothetical protein
MRNGIIWVLVWHLPGETGENYKKNSECITNYNFMSHMTDYFVS